MELDSWHLPAAYDFGLDPRFLESLCTPALCSYSPFLHWAATRWKTATLSVTERKSVVSSRDVIMPSVTIKNRSTNKESKDIREFIQSFVHSFISRILLWQYFHLRLNNKTNSQPSSPNQSCKHWQQQTCYLSESTRECGTMYSRQRGDMLRSSPMRRMRGIWYSNAPRWTNLTLYGINGDIGMRLWKSDNKTRNIVMMLLIYEHNLERRRGEFKGMRWKHHVMKAESHTYTVKWKLHKPEWLYNEIGKSETVQSIKSRHIIHTLLT
jgi:hypothetical protein